MCDYAREVVSLIYTVCMIGTVYSLTLSHACQKSLPLYFAITNVSHSNAKKILVMRICYLSDNLNKGIS